MQVFVYLLILVPQLTIATNPHIIFILADDLGWNDVGFHSSNQIPTPNIDALAYSGIILNNYYVTPICTPSRSALLTGKYPIHTGLQHGVIHGSTPYGLDLNETILPQFLKSSGYIAKAVGKWHLGSFRKEYTPEFRGFDSHYGYWTGHQDYYDHTAVEHHNYWGYDMRRGMKVAWSDYDKYSTDLFTNESVKIIENHDTKQPLFLYLAHLATHSANAYSPLQAPNETVAKFNYITDKNRRLFAGMLSKLDDSVGSVVQALAAKEMLNNSIIIFSTDNGGPAGGFDLNYASNWPLRGTKDSLWEGGVRGVGLVWSPLLPTGKVSNTMMHITDWLPTLLSVINATGLTGIDGMNIWESLSQGTPSPRTEILLNIDSERKIAGLRHENWKYIKGKRDDWNDWYGPSGREESYNWKALQNCVTAKAIKNIKPLPDKNRIKKLRTGANVVCPQKTSSDLTTDVFLFNINTDPCEKTNLASAHPDIVNMMEKNLQEYYKTKVTPRNKPFDPRSDPLYWGYAWVNWMDFVNDTAIKM